MLEQGERFTMGEYTFRFIIVERSGVISVGISVAEAEVEAEVEAVAKNTVMCV